MKVTKRRQEGQDQDRRRYTTQLILTAEEYLDLRKAVLEDGTSVPELMSQKVRDYLASRVERKRK